MTGEDVLRKALKVQDCAASAGDALREFTDHLRNANGPTPDAAAHAYMKAVGHLNDALATLNDLNVRRSNTEGEGGKE